jgi:hypothetical protein
VLFFFFLIYKCRESPLREQLPLPSSTEVDSVRTGAHRPDNPRHRLTELDFLLNEHAELDFTQYLPADRNFESHTTEYCGANCNVTAQGIESFLGSPIGFPDISINTPALEWATLSLNGYSPLGANPCTYCGRCDNRMNATNAFTNTPQPPSGLNDTWVGLPFDGTSLATDGSLLDVNSIMDQVPFMPYGNDDILPPNEIPLPDFGYDQGHQEQLMFPQNNAALGDNYQNFDATPNMMGFPAAPNVPNGPVAPIQAPPAAVQPAPGQRVPCTICTRTFGRASDLTRHMKSVHDVGPRVLHLCTVPGCPQSYGAGLSRKDKLLEHMRKVHGL